MAAKSISETKQVRYLLGLSSPAEREHIESEYFEDDDAFQQMLAAEDDLIDAYVSGELVGEQRQRFEQSFVRSLRGGDRVQFARAFAGVVSVTRSVETKLPGTWVNVFKSPGLFRTATIAVLIVIVAVLAWLVTDGRRMTKELRELRAESAELTKQTESLQQNSDAKRTHTAEIATLPDMPRNREPSTTVTQRAPHLPDVKNDREKIASSKPEPAEKLIHTEDAPLASGLEKRTIITNRKPEPAEPLINTQDVTLGNTFESKRITQLPLNANNVPGLLSLQPGTTRGGYVAGRSADQASIVLDGVDMNEPLNTYYLKPWNASNSETTIRISRSLSWITFQLGLETIAIHEEYQITIKTADGRPVISDRWTKPLTPNQTSIETYAILTSDLPAGDYVVLLMGKESDGSFVEVAEYSFKVTKY